MFSINIIHVSSHIADASELIVTQSTSMGCFLYLLNTLKTLEASMFSMNIIHVTSHIADACEHLATQSASMGGFLYSKSFDIFNENHKCDPSNTQCFLAFCHTKCKHGMFL